MSVFWRTSAGEFIRDKAQWIAFLAAFSLFGASLEYLFPRPVPFFRLGLANLALLLALPSLKGKDFFFLTLLKVLAQGIVFGTFLSYVFLFSLIGSFLSAAVMYLLFHLRLFSFLGISLAGAFTHNLAQILLAVVFIFGPQASALLPFFLYSALVSGLAVGVIAQKMSQKSFFKKMASFKFSLHSAEVFMPAHPEHREISKSKDILCEKELCQRVQEHKETARTTLAEKHLQEKRKQKRQDRLRTFFTPTQRLCWGILWSVLFIVNTAWEWRLGNTLFFLILVFFSGKRLSFLYFFFFLFSIVFFQVLLPSGEVLIHIFSFPVTQGALLGGLKKGIFLLGSVFISLFSIDRALKLPVLGNSLGDMMFYFEAFLREKKRIRPASFFQDMDRVLQEVFSTPRTEHRAQDLSPGLFLKKEKKERQKRNGIVIVFFLGIFLNAFWILRELWLV